MKFNLLKIFFLVSIIFFAQCEEIPNDVIETESVNYFVENISSPDEFAFSQTNTILKPFLTINNSQSVKSVWFVIKNEDGSEEISDIILMNTNNSTIKKTYSGEFTFDENLLSGNYEIDFFVEDNVNPNGNNIKKVGIKKFKYYSEAANLPPIISELNMPSHINTKSNFAFSIRINDPNGMNDIDSVYYQVKDPSGNLRRNSKNISKFPMFDDGKTAVNGDQIEKDGIYTVLLNFPDDSELGNWEFMFNAVDKSGLISNTINFSLKVN